MKGKFSLINGFTVGFSVVLKRNNISRCFYSVNSALPALLSSEDETPSIDDVNSSHFVSVERISRPCVGNRYVTNESRFLSSSAMKNSARDNDGMGVIMSILVNQGWRLNDLSCSCCGVELHEEHVVAALNGVFVETGSAELALRFFRWSEGSLGLKHTVRSICTLINLLVLGNMNYRVVDFLMFLVRGHPHCVQSEELVKLLREVCTRKVLETVYSMLVNCYTKENMVDEALRAIGFIEEFDIFPTAGVCNKVLKSLLDANRAELGWDLVEKMLERGLVSTAIISLFISYYCRRGDLDCGWKLLIDMKKYGLKPDVVAYTTFIHFLCKESYLKEATSLVFKMVEMGISPDSVLLTSVIYGYCKMGRPEDGVSIIRLFNICPNVFVYTSFISKLCKDSDMQKASIIFREMTASGILPDSFVYTTMIDGYCKARKISKALQYMGRMLKDGIEPSVATYTTLIDSYCRSGDMEVAQRLLKKMIGKDLIPDIVAYNTMINGYKNKGDLQKAYELLDMMKSFGISPDIVTYNTIIHGLVMKGYVAEANDMLDELIRRGFSPDVVTFSTVIGGYSNKGQFAEAFLMWCQMSNCYVRPDVITCSALISGYCRAHRMDEARVLFQKMQGFGLNPDLILYNTLIHGFCRSGNMEEAYHLITLMIEDGIVPDEVTYRALILGYEKNFSRNPAEKAFRKLQEILQRYDLYVVD